MPIPSVVEGTDVLRRLAYAITMEPDLTPRISFLERLGGGVVVTFADGRCALYSATLLMDVFSKAEALHDMPDLDDE